MWDRDSIWMDLGTEAEREVMRRAGETEGEEQRGRTEKEEERREDHYSEIRQKGRQWSAEERRDKTGLARRNREINRKGRERK